MKRLLWPVSLAVMSRIGRYFGVAVLARVAGRYEPHWPFLPYEEAALLAHIASRYGPYWPLLAV